MASRIERTKQSRKCRQTMQTTRQNGGKFILGRNLTKIDKEVGTGTNSETSLPHFLFQRGQKKALSKPKLVWQGSIFRFFYVSL